MKFCDFYLGKRLLADKVKYCDTFSLKLKGLMFVSSPGNGAFLPDVKDIHMNFVRFKLRILWLDKDFRVIDDKIAKRWRLYYGPENAAHVLELPVENATKIKMGEKLKINIYDNVEKRKRKGSK